MAKPTMKQDLIIAANGEFDNISTVERVTDNPLS